jgi:hypothetical protein
MCVGRGGGRGDIAASVSRQRMPPYVVDETDTQDVSQALHFIQCNRVTRCQRKGP